MSKFYAREKIFLIKEKFLTYYMYFITPLGLNMFKITYLQQTSDILIGINAVL